MKDFFPGFPWAPFTKMLRLDSTLQRPGRGKLEKFSLGYHRVILFIEECFHNVIASRPQLFHTCTVGTTSLGSHSGLEVLGS